MLSCDCDFTDGYKNCCMVKSLRVALEESEQGRNNWFKHAMASVRRAESAEKELKKLEQKRVKHDPR